MKFINMFGLLAMAAAALMAFTGTAVADSVTSDGGTTPTFKLTSTNVTLHNAAGTLSCSSALEGNVTGHGAGKNITGNKTSLTFTPCEGGSVHNATIKAGTFAINVTATNFGSWSASGTNFTLTMFGVECGYSTNNTSIGTVKGGTHATLHISGTLTRSHGSFFCGSGGDWTGDYKVNSPTNIHFHNN